MLAGSRTDEEPADPDPYSITRSHPRPDPGSGPAPDSVITAERDHLVRSREFLKLMREDVLSLNALAGDRVSQEYLKADLSRRAEALVDLPDTPLFFGRLDYEYSPWEEEPVADGIAD